MIFAGFSAPDWLGERYLKEWEAVSPQLSGFLAPHRHGVPSGCSNGPKPEPPTLYNCNFIPSFIGLEAV